MQKAKKKPIHIRNLQFLKNFLKRTAILFGSWAITPIALMILVQLAEAPLRATIQDVQRGLTSVPLDLAHHPTHVVLDVWLYTVDWIKKSNRKILRICVVLWHYNRVLSLQRVFCVCQLSNRNLSGMLHYSFSNKTTMFYLSRCAWDGRRAYPILPSEDAESGCYT